MRIFDRAALIKLHAIMAVFILPVAIMFFVTGALYTWGIKGGYDTTVHEIALAAPLEPELDMLVDLAKRELAQRDLPLPTGKARIKRIGTSFKLEWTGAGMDVVLEPATRPLAAKLAIKQATWYRQFVQLHKAKGGDPFKVYATVLAVFLILLLLTGFIVAWQVVELRGLTLASTAAGILVFVVMVFAS